MKRIGSLLAIVGVGSYILQALEREYILVSWIDSMPPSVADASRIALILLGAALFLLGSRRDNADDGADRA